MNRIKLAIRLLRSNQYVKNLFIFLPVFFGMKFFDLGRILHVCLAFICFSLVASAVYVLNDICDIQEDRKHPRKRNRPIASGETSKREAFGITSVLLFMGVGFSLYYFPIDFFGVLLIYIFMNVIYSLKLKHFAILDITIIAFGFVLRLFVGSIAGGITLSHWIILMTFLLALFLALAKRRDDLLIYLSDGKIMRKSIEGYNLTFIDTAMSIVAAVVIVSYVLYTVSAEATIRFKTDKLYMTTFFVITGVLRYLQITFVKEESESPTRILLHDRALQGIIIGWLILFGLIIYR